MKTFRSVAVTMSGLVGISSMLLACSAEDASSTGTRSEAEQASGPGATASSVRDESSSEPAAAAAADEGASSAAGDPLAGTLAVPVVPTVAPAVFVNPTRAVASVTAPP